MHFIKVERVGAGATPIKIEQGWLEIYHGADAQHRYCLAAFLMDGDDPSKVLARTPDPIMVPTENYVKWIFRFRSFYQRPCCRWRSADDILWHRR